jgi:FAD/FMN-containing dehydrogenase
MSGRRRPPPENVGGAGAPVVVHRPESLEEIRQLLRGQVGPAGAAASRRRQQPQQQSSPIFVVRNSEPDDRAMALVPEGGAVVVVSNASAGAGSPVSVPTTPTEGNSDEAAPRASVTLSRFATVRDLTTRQKSSAKIRHSVFPLAASGLDKPVLSALFRNNDPRFPQNYYQRSAPKPQDQLKSFTYLPLSARTARDVVETTWTQAQGVPVLDDKLVLSATLAPDPNEARRQVRRAVLLYDPGVFDRDVLDSFRTNYARALAANKLDGVDVTVEVCNKPAYVAALVVVVITASSTDRRHDQALEALFPRLFGSGAGSSALLQSYLLVDPVDIQGMGTPMADRHKAFNLPSREFGATLTVSGGGTVDALFYWLKWAVYAAAHQQGSNLQAHFRLVPADGKMYANVVVFEVRQDAQHAGMSPQEIEDFPPPFPALPPPGLVEVGAGAPALRRSISDVAGEQRPAKVARVEWEVLIGKDHPEYNKKLRSQYASFKGSYPDEYFLPHRIARPETVNDVKTAVAYAAKNNKRVVARSGGHQYCGYSSGDDGSVQIVMDYMMDTGGMVKGMELSSEPAQAVRARGCSVVSTDKKDRQWFVTVAPRCRLEDVSLTLKTNHLTIPHGECPRVGIGGHVQTGGYGHQLRGLGLCLDYVYSFDIVVYTTLKNRKEPSVDLVTVYRPEMRLADVKVDQGLNDSIYKGVLGGSPGAFGVITRIKFLAVHDEDDTYADSHNVTKVYAHNGWDVQKATTNVVRKMLKFALPNAAPSLCEGLDVFVSITSYEVGPAEFGLVLPELAYTGPTFSPEARGQMKEILDACRAVAIPLSGPALLAFGKGQDLRARPPSDVAHTGVRTPGGGVTSDGREFDHPYKKRVNSMLTTDSLSEQDAEKFAHGFGKLAQQVVLDPDLLLVIQMFVGGGKAATNDANGMTGIPYRNHSFLFVFDVFYKSKGPESKAKAEKIQDDLQELLDEVGGGCFNHRSFWGSFGRENGETNMADSVVQTIYYESTDAYAAMQKIKDRVDPKGVFTTEFTVQNSQP